MNDQENETGHIESNVGNEKTTSEDPVVNKNFSTQETPPPKKGKKKLAIILGIVGGIIILAALTFFLFNQFYPSNSNQTGGKTIENTTDKEQLKKLYDELISSYIASGKSEAEILALLEKAAKETGDQSYLTEKENYLVKNPSFNLVPGAYQGTQSLEIIKGTTADQLFYTVDGSVPGKTATEYTGPITLPIGETTVKVIEVNPKGISSQVLEGKYILTSSQINTQSVLSPDEFINRLYGVWYKTDFGNSLTISQTTYTEHIPKPLSNATGDYIVVSTTENGGTIKVLNFTVEGYNAGDTLIEFDFGAPGDNQMRLRHEGKPWWDYTAAEYLGNGQYMLPFEFAGSNIITLN